MERRPHGSQSRYVMIMGILLSRAWSQNPNIPREGSVTPAPNSLATKQPACGGRYLVDFIGALSSPGYPDGYSGNQNCTYVFYRSQSPPPVYLILHQLELHPNIFCEDAYVQFFDGPSPSSPSLTGKICNNVLYRSVRSSGRYLTMVFRTKEASRQGGFLLTWGECNSSHPLRCEDKLGCIADYNYCDGKFDCSDRSDEAPSKCPHTEPPDAGASGPSKTTSIVATVFVIGGFILFVFMCRRGCSLARERLERSSVEIVDVDDDNGPSSLTQIQSVPSVHSVGNVVPSAPPGSHSPPGYGEFDSYPVINPRLHAFEDAPINGHHQIRDDNPQPSYIPPTVDDIPDVPPPAYDSLVHFNDGSRAATYAPS